MKKSAILYERGDLELAEKELLAIKNACNKLEAFSLEKGGIPFIERNVARIRGALNPLMSISEVLEIIREP